MLSWPTCDPTWFGVFDVGAESCTHLCTCISVGGSPPERYRALWWSGDACSMFGHRFVFCLPVVEEGKWGTWESAGGGVFIMFSVDGFLVLGFAACLASRPGVLRGVLCSRRLKAWRQGASALEPRLSTHACAAVFLVDCCFWLFSRNRLVDHHNTCFRTTGLVIFASGRLACCLIVEVWLHRQDSHAAACSCETRDWRMPGGRARTVGRKAAGFVSRALPVPCPLPAV